MPATHTVWLDEFACSATRCFAYVHSLTYTVNQ
jgi:hypothetical protein